MQIVEYDNKNLTISSKVVVQEATHTYVNEKYKKTKEKLIIGKAYHRLLEDATNFRM